jgi:hypothetical protein
MLSSALYACIAHINKDIYEARIFAKKGAGYFLYCTQVRHYALVGIVPELLFPVLTVAHTQ